MAILKYFGLAALILLVHSPAYGFKLFGFKTPESVIVDPATGYYYVSNINGSPKGKDNNGYIVRIESSGKSSILNFIKGGKKQVQLNAPKGMALVGNELFVTDIDTIRRFDKNTGKPLGPIDFSPLGVKFLNDLAVGPKGLLYVSDSGGNAIYTINTRKNFQVDLFAKSPTLGNPNGLLYDPIHERLIVATFGSGKIIGIDSKGKIIALVGKKFKGLDGIDFDREGNLLVADHKAGIVYRIRNYSKVEIVRKRIVTPADISFDYKKNQILVPSFRGNIVFSIPLE